MNKPHVHAELIKAWADGAEIEVLSPFGSWCLVKGQPVWVHDFEYRIKPDPFADFKHALADGMRVDVRVKGMPSGVGWLELSPTHESWTHTFEYRIAQPWQDERDAFARGEPIQFRRKAALGEYFEEAWKDCKAPIWAADCEYRVKPKTQSQDCVVASIAFVEQGSPASFASAPFKMPTVHLTVEHTEGIVTNITLKDWKP